jgi:hypothetical protein
MTINNGGGMSDCPYCDGRGYHSRTIATHGCDGTEEMCHRICPVPDEVQDCCEFCGGSGEINYQTPQPKEAGDV